MLETPHAIVGATIVTKIPNPLISIPLAFASHFVLDMIPHWNPHLNTEIKKFGKVTLKSRNIVILDVLLALASGFYIASLSASDTSHMAMILFGAFSGVLPDVIEGPYFFLNMKSKFITRWLAFQKSIQVDTDIIPGIATQIATIAATFLIILN